MVLAYAGLARIGHVDAITQIFEPDEMLPAPGQGALAVECREGDAELAALLQLVTDEASMAAVTAERSLLEALEAGCSAPIGAYAAAPTQLRLQGGRHEPGRKPHAARARRRPRRRCLAARPGPGRGVAAVRGVRS